MCTQHKCAACVAVYIVTGIRVFGASLTLMFICLSKRDNLPLLSTFSGPRYLCCSYRHHQHMLLLCPACPTRNIRYFIVILMLLTRDIFQRDIYYFIVCCLLCIIYVPYVFRNCLLRSVLYFGDILSKILPAEHRYIGIFIYPLCIPLYLSSYWE